MNDQEFQIAMNEMAGQRNAAMDALVQANVRIQMQASEVESLKATNQRLEEALTAEIAKSAAPDSTQVAPEQPL